MSKQSYTENYNLTQYSEVQDPVFLNDITRDNAIIDSALQENKETAENAVSVANTSEDIAEYAKSVADNVASDLQVTNQNVTDLEARVTQNESDIALLQPAKITALENKIDTNTGLINSLSNELDSVEAEVESHGTRLDSAESDIRGLRTDVDTLRSDFDTCCTDVQAHLSTLDSEQGVQNERLGGLESRMTSAEGRLDNLETEDETITEQVQILTDRVNQLLSDLDPNNLQTTLALTQLVVENKNNIIDLIASVEAIEELDGNETLITTAQTLTGAINEIAGFSVVVDSALDITSEHAVQNKVLTGLIGTDALITTAQTITSALNELKGLLDTVNTREDTHYTNLSNGLSGIDSRVGALETAVGDSTSGLVKGLADANDDIDAIEQSLGDVIVTVGDNNSGLVKGLSDAQSDISSLETTVGDSTAGLVHDVAGVSSDVSTLKSTVGDSTTGLVKDVDDLTSDVLTLEATVGNNSSGLVKDVNDLQNTVSTIANTVKNELHPVGSVYMTISNTNPATLLGFGTWSLLSEGYLKNGGSSASGGSMTSGSHAITTDEMPSHSHTIAHTHNVSGNTGAMSGNATGRARFSTQFMDAQSYNFVPAFVNSSGNISALSTTTDYAVEAHPSQNMGGALLDIDVSHTHDINITSGNPSNSDSGSAGNGAGHTHSIEPTYTRIYAWERTA